MEDLKVFLTANDTSGIVYNIPNDEIRNRVTINLQDSKLTTKDFLNAVGQHIISHYDTFKCVTYFKVFDMEFVVLVHDITSDMRILLINQSLPDSNICTDLFAFLPQGSLADIQYSDSDLSFDYNYQDGYSVYLRVTNRYKKASKYLKISSNGEVSCTTECDFLDFNSPEFEQILCVEKFPDPILFYTVKHFRDGATLTVPNTLTEIAFSKVVLKVTRKNDGTLNLYKI